MFLIELCIGAGKMGTLREWIQSYGRSMVSGTELHGKTAGPGRALHDGPSMPQRHAA